MLPVGMACYKCTHFINRFDPNSSIFMLKALMITLLTIATTITVPARNAGDVMVLDYLSPAINLPIVETADVSAATIDTSANYTFSLNGLKKLRTPSIYQLPYSLTLNVPNWKQLWVNSAIFAGAFSGTLFVLECLPEDATSWNRAALQDIPPGKRWRDHIFRDGPEWDHDKFYFNYLLHPYAGAVYFMAARSAGFNFWRSLLYCSIVSHVGWEFGIEAFMERPSYQDLIITPVAGCVIGELFYKLKRRIVRDDYHLWGSSLAGNIVAFLIDPVNEVVGLFGHHSTRHLYEYENDNKQTGVVSSLMPAVVGGAPGFTLVCRF